MRTAGFNLIETIIVVALLGVVATFGVSMSTNTLLQSTVAQERDLFVSLLIKHSRGAALANIHSTSHGIMIDTENRRYTLFEGRSYVATSSLNRHIPFASAGVHIEQSEPTPIIFEQRSAAVSTGTGTIHFRDADKAYTVTIRESGQIDW